jgi:hypothetical protein
MLPPLGKIYISFFIIFIFFDFIIFFFRIIIISSFDIFTWTVALSEEDMIGDGFAGAAMALPDRAAPARSPMAMAGIARVFMA